MLLSIKYHFTELIPRFNTVALSVTTRKATKGRKVWPGTNIPDYRGGMMSNAWLGAVDGQRIREINRFKLEIRAFESPDFYPLLITTY